MRVNALSTYSFFRMEVLKELQKDHILAIPAGENVVRFLPPFIIEKEHIDEVVEVLKIIIT